MNFDFYFILKALKFPVTFMCIKPAFGLIKLTNKYFRIKKNNI